MQGVSCPVGIATASVHLVCVPMLRPYRFAGGLVTERTLVLVRLGDERADGWGEAAPVPGYSPETADAVFAAMADALPGLPGMHLHPGDAGGALPPDAPAAARHALETAAWDLAGRASGIPLATLIGGRPGRVAVGAVLGLGTTPQSAAAAGRALLDAGHARVKVKLAGIGDLPALAALADALPAGRLAADANGSLPASLAGTLADRIAPLRLAYLEQPFPPGDLDASAVMNEVVPVCLDEQITDPAAAERALAAGAASLIAVKPARVGGIGAALRVLEAARRRGAGALVGGMLESGIGRAASLALATVPGFTQPADLAPTLDYLAHDLVTRPQLLGPGGVAVPNRPGWGGTVDTEAVARITVRSATAR